MSAPLEGEDECQGMHVTNGCEAIRNVECCRIQRLDARPDGDARSEGYAEDHAPFLNVIARKQTAPSRTTLGSFLEGYRSEALHAQGSSGLQEFPLASCGRAFHRRFQRPARVVMNENSRPSPLPWPPRDDVRP